jgi:hypothetical protein
MRCNAVCTRFFSKIPQVGTEGVNFLAQELKENVNYFCCPPIKMVGRVACHLLEKANVSSILLVPVWPSTAYWSSLSESVRFQEAVVNKVYFRPQFFMSNGASGLFSRKPNFEMVAFLLKS